MDKVLCYKSEGRWFVVPFKHTALTSVTPTVLSVATSTPKGCAVGSIPACGIQVTVTPKFVTSGLCGLPKEVEVENASTARQA